MYYVNGKDKSTMIKNREPAHTPLELSFEEKISWVNQSFSSFSEPEKKYHFLIELGRNLPPLSPEFRTEERLVRGCQSRLYLHTEFCQGKVFFSAQADALISAGLAALLIAVYSGETPETILKRPPDFLHELGIASSLSPNRSNGLAQIHLRMRQESLKFLLAPSAS